MARRLLSAAGEPDAAESRLTAFIMIEADEESVRVEPDLHRRARRPGSPRPGPGRGLLARPVLRPARVHRRRAAAAAGCAHLCGTRRHRAAPARGGGGWRALACPGPGSPWWRRAGRLLPGARADQPGRDGHGRRQGRIGAGWLAARCGEPDSCPVDADAPLLVGFPGQAGAGDVRAGSRGARRRGTGPCPRSWPRRRAARPWRRRRRARPCRRAAAGTRRCGRAGPVPSGRGGSRAARPAPWPSAISATAPPGAGAAAGRSPSPCGLSILIRVALAAVASARRASPLVAGGDLLFMLGLALLCQNLVIVRRHSHPQARPGHPVAPADAALPGQLLRRPAPAAALTSPAPRGTRVVAENYLASLPTVGAVISV